jgi:UDP-N-acetylmuramate dehydrogenase
MQDVIEKLKDELLLSVDPTQVLMDESLRNHTTWRIGGNADLFFKAKSESDVITAVTLAKKHSVPFFILGGGANILVGDKGYRGFVIKNLYEVFKVLDKNSVGYQLEKWEEHSTGTSKHVAVHYRYYDDSKNPSFNAEPVFIEVSSGYSMPHFIRDMLNHSFTGLEWFSRIPGSMGGWIYNNVHGHTIFIGDFIHTVRILTESGEVVEKRWNELDFGYDYSIFHTNKDVILSCVIRLFKGNIELAREVVKEVIINKNARQAANSAGCVFHNISKEDQLKNNFESDAVGYIIDKKLDLLGKHKVGGAWISSKHGNFIETDGTASAQDVLAVMNFMADEVKKHFNIELKDEIFRVGDF